MLSKLLWCEPEDYKPGDSPASPQYSLKTPHESVHIQVEDVPFIIVDYKWKSEPEKQRDKQQDNQELHSQNTPVMLCSTNLGECISVGINHPIYIHPNPPYLPYVKVRRNLWARLNRNVYYRLIDELLAKHPETTDQLSLESNGHHFIIAGGNDENS